MSCQALLACAAEARQARHYVIAGLYIHDVVADGFDDAGTLVAEHAWFPEWVAAVPVNVVEVTVAHPRRGSAYQHLASSGRVDVNALDRQRLPRLAEDGSLR